MDRVIARTGRGEQRRRLLPARVVIYYTPAMCLFTQVGYEEVMRCGYVLSEFHLWRLGVVAQMTKMTTRTKRVTGMLLVSIITCGHLSVAL